MGGRDEGRVSGWLYLDGEWIQGRCRVRAVEAASMTTRRNFFGALMEDYE